MLKCEDADLYDLMKKFKSFISNMYIKDSKFKCNRRDL